jgi:hypothetical protein
LLDCVIACCLAYWAFFLLDVFSLLPCSPVFCTIAIVLCVSPFVYFGERDRLAVFYLVLGGLMTLGASGVMIRLTGHPLKQPAAMRHLMFVAPIIFGLAAARVLLWFWEPPTQQ